MRLQKEKQKELGYLHLYKTKGKYKLIEERLIRKEPFLHHHVLLIELFFSPFIHWQTHEN